MPVVAAPVPAAAARARAAGRSSDVRRFLSRAHVRLLVLRAERGQPTDEDRTARPCRRSPRSPLRSPSPGPRAAPSRGTRARQRQGRADEAMEVSSNWSGYVATGTRLDRDHREPDDAVQERDRHLEAARRDLPGDGRDLGVARSGSGSAATARGRPRSSRRGRRPTAPTGKATYYAWYELVPEPSITIKNLKIKPGRHDHGIGRRQRHRGAGSGSRTARGSGLLEARDRREPRPDLGRVDRRGAVRVLVERLLPADPARQLRVGHVHEGRGARVDLGPRRPGRDDLEHALAVDARPARAAADAALLRRRGRASRRDHGLGGCDAVRASRRRRLVQRRLGREREACRVEHGCACGSCSRARRWPRSRCPAPRRPRSLPGAARGRQVVKRVAEGQARGALGRAAPEVPGRASRGRASSPASARTPRRSARSRSSASRPRARPSSTWPCRRSAPST